MATLRICRHCGEEITPCQYGTDWVHAKTQSHICETTQIKLAKPEERIKDLDLRGAKQ